jgi:hypothetical protein
MTNGSGLRRIPASLCLVLALGACADEQGGCLSMLTGRVLVVIHGLATCEGVHVTYEDDGQLLADATSLARDDVKGTCSASYRPPDELSLDSVHVTVLDAGGTTLAEDSIDRHYDDECGQYKDVTVELTVGQ